MHIVEDSMKNDNVCINSSVYLKTKLKGVFHEKVYKLA